MEERAPWSCRSEREVAIPVGHATLGGGVLHWPYTAEGIVVFAHGGGSGSASQRNRLVAEALQRSGLATLLVDLDTERAASPTGGAGWDLGRLARRLAG